MINKVLISDRQNKVKIPSGTRLLVRRCCNAVLANENFPYSAEVGVSFVDNDEIRKLNAEHRGKDAVTDVLSFPIFEDGKYMPNAETGVVTLGDIVLSVEKAVEQAGMYSHTFQREVAYLTVHSMLHLLGHHHEAGGIQEVHMREREEHILKQLGVPRGMSYVADDLGK